MTLACIFTGLCGCESLNKQPVTLADSISIPADGMIESSVFEALKAENKAVTFKGQSGDIRYEWIVFGSDIKEAKTLNLGIEIMEADSERLSFRFLSEDNFGFSPTLSIYLNVVWEAQSASVCGLSESDSAKKQDVSITGGKQSILNFSPEEQTGAFVITPDTEKDTAAPSSAAESTADSVSDSPEPSETLAAPESSDTNLSENSDKPQMTYSAQNAKPSKTQPSPAENQTPGSSETSSDSGRQISDGKSTEQDKYKTDPVPEGKPVPVEPENQAVDTRKAYTCTFSIECTSIFNHLNNLESGKLDVLPKNGIIFAPQTVTFYEGESVYDVLKRVCRENKIHMEASFTPVFNSSYVEGIGNLYEFDCGSGSGWMYRVDGWYPNYGCSRYQLKQGETVEWRYTCELGRDIGGANAVGG